MHTGSLVDARRGWPVALLSVLATSSISAPAFGHPVHDEHADAPAVDDCGPHGLPPTPPNLPLVAPGAALLNRVDSSGETTAITAVAGQVHRLVVRPNE